MKNQAPKAAMALLAVGLGFSPEAAAKEPNWQNRTRACAVVREQVRYEVDMASPVAINHLQVRAVEEGIAAEKACRSMNPKTRRQRFARLF